MYIKVFQKYPFFYKVQKFEGRCIPIVLNGLDEHVNTFFYPENVLEVLSVDFWKTYILPKIRLDFRGIAKNTFFKYQSGSLELWGARGF